MKKMAWKDIAELIGMTAIVLSLALVAYEVRQNTRALEQEAAATYAANSIALNLFVAGSSDFSSIIVKAREEQLSRQEQLRLWVFYRGVTRNWQNTYFQYLSGALDERFWESEVVFMESIMKGNAESWRPYWNQEQAIFAKDFRELISEMLEEN